MIQPHTTIQRAPELFDKEVNGETMMVSLQSGEYFGLNAIGNQLWKWLETPKTFSQLTELILQEYDVEKEQCHTDLRAFLEALQKQKLITCS